MFAERGGTVRLEGEISWRCGLKLFWAVLWQSAVPGPGKLMWESLEVGFWFCVSHQCQQISIFPFPFLLFWPVAHGCGRSFGQNALCSDPFWNSRARFCATLEKQLEAK